MELGTRLDVWIENSPLDRESCIRIAILLAKHVHSIHKQKEVIGVLHPYFIRLHEDRVLLTPVDVPHVSHERYQSPEHSGKINRNVDIRSNLYVLGILLYELLTGRMPYEPVGDEQWAEAHIGRQPAALAQQPLEQIIMKLLRKSPEDRYQSGYGLLYDLMQYQQALEQGTHDHILDIGIMDHRSQFHYPAMLFGRDEEMKALQEGYARVKDGQLQHVILTGAEGAGKSSLLDNFCSWVRENSGRYIEVSCKSGKTAEDYYAISQIAKQCLQHFFALDAFLLSELRARVLQLSAGQLKFLCQHIPELKRLLGESDVRAAHLNASVEQQAFIAFIQILVQSIQMPVVIAVDEFDWCDRGSQDVMQLLVQEKLSGLPLMLVQSGQFISADGSRESSTRVLAHSKVIALGALSYEDIRKLVTAIVYDDSVFVRMLAQFIFYLTEGQPVLIERLLQRWVRNQKLTYDENCHAWTCDEDIQAQLKEVEELNQYISISLNRLPASVRELLAIAAVMGSGFYTEVLAQATGIAHDQVLEQLKLAEDEGILYDNPGMQTTLTYRSFLYVKARQMLYQELKLQQQHWHLVIGNVLRTNFLDKVADAEQLAVMYLNQAADLLRPDERQALLEDNMVLGIKARSRADYQAARDFFEAGLTHHEALSPAGEASVRGSKLLLYLADAEYCYGNEQQMRARYTQLAPSLHLLDRSDKLIYAMQQLGSNTFVNNELAVEHGKEALALYDWLLPESVSPVAIVKEVLKTKHAIRSARRNLDQLKVNDDPEYVRLCDLNVGLVFPFLAKDPGLLIYHFARFIRYGLQYGINESFLYIIGAYEILLQRGAPVVYNFYPARLFADLEAIVSTDQGQRYGVMYILGLYHQLENPQKSQQYLYKTLRQGVVRRNYTHVNLHIITCLVTYNGDIRGLQELLDFIEAEAETLVDGKTTVLVSDAKQYCRAMQHTADQLAYIQHKDSFEAYIHENYVCICKAEVALLANQYETSLYWIERARNKEFEQDWVQNRKVRIYEALCYAGLYSRASARSREQYEQMLSTRLKKMKKWEGFLGAGTAAYYLIEGSLHAIREELPKAKSAYERAIREARTSRYFWAEAVGLERLAQILSKLDNETSTTIAQMDAAGAYSRWGAISKFEQMRQENTHMNWSSEHAPHKELVDYRASHLARWDTESYGTTQLLTEERALQTMSRWKGHWSNSDFIQSFLTMAYDQSGANRAYVFQAEGEQVRILASKETEGDQPAFPLQVIQYVRNSGEIMRCGNVSRSQFHSDPDIQSRQQRSIICMDIRMPAGSPQLLLYLENSEISDVFTEKTQLMLELMLARFVYLVPQESLNSEQLITHFTVPTGAATPLLDPLTEREQEVLRALAKGMSNQEIATHLNITVATVKTHINKVYGKLDVKRRGQAIAKGVELGLITL